MNLKMTFVLHFLMGMSLSVIKVEGIRCYVCGGEGETPCNDFDLKKDTYVKLCEPHINKGCEKVTSGHTNTVVRKCSDRGFIDCKPANGVEYCYCVTDLCNSNLSKWTGHTDDEDFVEGSGTTTVSSETENSVVVTKKKSLGTKIDLCRSLILISFGIIIYNN